MDETTQIEPMASIAGVILLMIYLGAMIITVIGFWKVFTKANQPGWAVLVPIYNVFVLMKIIGRPGWWVLLFFLPFVNMIAAVFACLELAKAFGKGALFGLGLLFLAPIFGVILGFGDAKYEGAPSH